MATTVQQTVMREAFSKALIRYIMEHPSVVIRSFRPDVDVTRVMGVIVPEDEVDGSSLPDCGCKCECCSMYLSGQCESIYEEFCPKEELL